MTQDSLKKGLNHQLNIHGYSFQYAVLKAAMICFEKRDSPWSFEVSEFPVTVNEVPIHIDFILRNINEPFYFIGECKRADPAISNWCFVKAPYVYRNRSTNERIVREVIDVEKNNPRVCLDWLIRSNEVYRLAFEVKSSDKGEGISGRGQINEAITQVLRGMNGLITSFIKYYKNNGKLPLGRYKKEWHRAAFMPVIFTTANLWVSDINLSSAELNNGNVDVSKIKLEPKNWVYYHYAQSPNIKHPFENCEKREELSDILYLDYTRTIPIVNSRGIETFLKDNSWAEYVDWNKLSTAEGDG